MEPYTLRPLENDKLPVFIESNRFFFVLGWEVEESFIFSPFLCTVSLQFPTVSLGELFV